MQYITHAPDGHVLAQPQINIAVVVGNHHVRQILILKRQHEDDMSSIDKDVQTIRVALQQQYTVGQRLAQLASFQQRIALE